jgi:CRP-like cAMP-binding protein
MRASHLETLPLFAALSEDARDQLARSARRVRFEPGEQIVRERAFSFEFFVIERGTAEVLRGFDHVADLSDGDFFGEEGVLPQGGLRWSRRNASVVATSPVTAISISGHDFRQAFEDIPELRDAILSAVVARRRASKVAY